MKGVLYLQSSYSMLKSMIPLEELVLACKNANYSFIALTDEQLHGSYELFSLANKYNIRPILGMSLLIQEPYETTFLIYVKNEIGYKNLLKLSKLKADNHIFNFEDLVTYQKGLIFVTAGYESVIDQTMLYGNQGVLLDIMKKYQVNFDDFYVGISFNHEIQKNYSSFEIYQLALQNKIKTLPVHQTRYLKNDFKESYENYIKIDNINNKVDQDANYSFIELKEVNSNYSSYTKISSYLEDFLNSITFQLNFPKFNLPIYETDFSGSNKDYLISLAKIGLKRRLKLNKVINHLPYITRLDHELDIITKMDFEDYFLTVYDFIKYAKTNDVLVGPGRGSAAGSLVSYCLGITDVDPIKYGLMFERFLNPSRMSMPDIDIDFPDNKRDMVIDYVRNKYGDEHICSITTFSSFAIRSSIRDIARVLKLPQNRVEGIIQSIINNNYDESDIEVVKVIKLAKMIEGLYRQTGTHAAGIILSQEKLTDFIPMQRGAFDFNQAQYDAKTLEKLGLNKIDFLGIRNLTIISEIIKDLKTKGINIDLNNLNMEDKKTFNLLSKGDTTGLFQLESAGMRKVLEKLKPNKFEDLVATLALYRPGPMQNIDIYIERRNGQKFEYLHKDLEPVLNKTFGIIIYQEQIMQIAQIYAGYDLFDADMLRVGVSKKDLVILENERTKFVAGATSKGYSKELSNEIYDYIVKFADYGFNRSHSVSYGIVSYQMAYLKANYYEVFMKVLLNSVIGNETQTSQYIKESINNNLTILPPHLNMSSNCYELHNNALVMPFNTIKGFGVKVVNDLLEERSKGQFHTLIEVKERLSKILSEQQFTNLVYSGALDFLKLNRKTLIENSNLADIEFTKYIADYQIKELEDYSFNDNANFEKTALGLNIIFDLQTLIDQNNPNQARYLKVSDIDLSAQENYLIGFISEIKEYTNKNNEIMYFIVITDGLNNLDVTVFSNLVKEKSALFNDKLSIFKVKSNTYQNRQSYILDNIANLTI